MTKSIQLSILCVALACVACAVDSSESGSLLASEQGGPGGIEPLGGTGCFQGGCSGQLCSSDPYAASTCEWEPWYECFDTGVCEPQLDGACGWTPSDDLCACVESKGGELEGCDDRGGGDEQCHRAGCSGQLCTDDPDVASTCEWREWYACFREGECARQGSGQCGWTPSDDLCACVVGLGGVLDGCE
ncbi:MAG: hypothetical protein IT379_15155 [Deltaproteobacteria bacterium]|nr:hypothetical protein [Deltaproteobacteria bacterium]